MLRVVKTIKIPFLLSLVLLASCASKEKDAPPKKGPPPMQNFEAYVANAFPINRSLEAAGTILPNEITDLHPEVSGRVTSISFTEGGSVRKGNLLVKIFDGDLQAQLRKLAVQLKIAEATAQRQKQLLAISGTSQEEYDNASLQVSNIKADMELLRVNISKTDVRAPFDGRAGLRLISPGAYVTPQTIITNIASLTQIKIEFTVPEKYIGEMQNGKSVSFKMDGNYKEYFATVMATDNSVTADSRNLKIRAVVKNPDGLLKPGAFASVQVNIGANSPAIMLPTQAVIPLTRGKQVIVLRKGLTVFQKVETGYRDSSRVEILNGIQNGDTVLTSGLLVVKQGQKVGVNVK